MNSFLVRLSALMLFLLLLGHLTGTAAAAPLARSSHGDWPLQSDSPLGEWRGVMNCRGRPSAGAVKVAYNAEYGASAEFTWGGDIRKTLWTKYWAWYNRTSARIEFDPSTRQVRLTHSDRRLGPLELTIGRDGTLSGRMTGECSSARLERYDYAPSAQETRARVDAMGKSLSYPLSWLVSREGIVAQWNGVQSCRLPDADISITAVDPRALVDGASALTNFLDRLKVALSLECPDARRLNVKVMGRALVWDPWNRASWAMGAAIADAGTAAPSAGGPSTEGPYGMPALSTLPFEGRQQAVKRAYWDAARRYKAQNQPILESMGVRVGAQGDQLKDPDTPFQMGVMAHQMCKSNPAEGGADTAGRACYFAGLLLGDLIEGGGGDVRNVFDYFMDCARVARLKECALLAEYMAEFDANPVGLAAAREIRSSATVAIESPQSEIRRILPKLIARNHRYDFPPEVRRCLNIRREGTREVTVRRDQYGQEKEVPGTASIRFDYFLDNKCGQAVAFSGTCEVGLFAQQRAISGTLAPGASMNINKCRIRRGD